MIQKELSMRFVFAYTAPEFVDATRMLAKNPELFQPLITGHGTLDGITDAFDTLERGGSQPKLLIQSVLISCTGRAGGDTFESAGPDSTR